MEIRFDPFESLKDLIVKCFPSFHRLEILKDRIILILSIRLFIYLLTDRLLEKGPELFPSPYHDDTLSILLERKDMSGNHLVDTDRFNFHNVLAPFKKYSFIVVFQ